MTPRQVVQALAYPKFGEWGLAGSENVVLHESCNVRRCLPGV
jgi:hypothetical protein